MPKGFCRCGLCNEDFESTEQYDRHAKLQYHKDRLARFFKMFDKEGFAVCRREDFPAKQIRNEFPKGFRFR